MLERIKQEIGLECFPCYGQHHAIVFYADKHGSLITPRRLSTLLQTTTLLQILHDYSYYNLNAWAENVIRLTPKATFASVSSAPPPTSIPSSSKRVHQQPHPTGSLVRKHPTVESSFVSKHPVPNNVIVHLLEEQGEFAFIRYDKLQGWVRSRYLSPPQT